MNELDQALLRDDNGPNSKERLRINSGRKEQGQITNSPPSCPSMFGSESEYNRKNEKIKSPKKKKPRKYAYSFDYEKGCFVGLEEYHITALLAIYPDVDWKSVVLSTSDYLMEQKKKGIRYFNFPRILKYNFWYNHNKNFMFKKR